MMLFLFTLTVLFMLLQWWRLILNMAKDSKNEVSIIISGTQRVMSTTAPPTGCKGATKSKEKAVLKGGVKEPKQLVSGKR